MARLSHMLLAPAASGYIERARATLAAGLPWQKRTADSNSNPTPEAGVYSLTA